jgi:predicted Fe-S protein YdhL (DUF1289 family)
MRIFLICPICGTKTETGKLYCPNDCFPRNTYPQGLRREYESPSQTTTTVKGPGGYLRDLLHAKGYTAVSGCGCNSKAAQMDEWGVDGCRRHIDEIVDWLAAAAKKSGWVMSVLATAPFSRELVRLKIRELVEDAIEKAESAG